MGRVKEVIYREFTFPSYRGAKIQIVTDQKEASVTIDVEDVMKQEAVCSVLKFQAKDEDFGFIAVRMQFYTSEEGHSAQRKERLVYMQK